MSYHCQWYNRYIDPTELWVRAHQENLVLHNPFSPPHPRINPADSSLSFVDDCAHPIDESMDCADVSIPETQPDPSTASIFIHVGGCVQMVLLRILFMITLLHPLLLRFWFPRPTKRSFFAAVLLSQIPSLVIWLFVLHYPLSTLTHQRSLIHVFLLMNIKLPDNPIQLPSTSPDAAHKDQSSPVNDDNGAAKSQDMSTPSTTYSAPYPRVHKCPKHPLSPCPSLPLSLNDSSGQGHLLFGSPSPRIDVASKPLTATQRCDPPCGDERKVFLNNDCNPPMTKGLVQNDLQHRLIIILFYMFAIIYQLILFIIILQ